MSHATSATALLLAALTCAGCELPRGRAPQERAARDRASEIWNAHVLGGQHTFDPPIDFVVAPEEWRHVVHDESKGWTLYEHFPGPGHWMALTLEPSADGKPGNDIHISIGAHIGPPK